MNIAFLDEEIELLNRVVGPASATQRAWLAGFLAGVDAQAGPPVAGAARGATTLSFTSADAMPKVAAYFREAAARAGYTLDPEVAAEGLAMLSGRRADGADFSLTLVPEGAGASGLGRLLDGLGALAERGDDGPRPAHRERCRHGHGGRRGHRSLHPRRGRVGLRRVRGSSEARIRGRERRGVA